MESIEINFQFSKLPIFKKKYNFIFFLILLIGAFLRFYRLPAYVEFLGDQGRDLLHVRDFLVNKDLMFIGPRTSVGDMYLGPWYYYLMAPFLLLSNYNPLGPVVMVTLFSLATVYLLYRIGSDWFNRQAGIIAACFGAVSPVLIKFSTFSWNPNIMPFFSLLSIWLTYRIWQKKEYKKLIWLAIALAMVLNSHYLGLLLFPPIGLFLLLTFLKSKKENNLNHFLKSALLSFGVFSLLMSPLILFDLKHDWQNFSSLQNFFFKDRTSVDLEIYNGFSDIPEVVSQTVNQFFLNKDSGIPVILSFSAVLLVLWLGRKKKTIWLLGATFLVGVLGLANYQNPIYAHYLGFIYPLLALMFAYLLTKIKGLGWIVFLMLSVLMFINWHGWTEPNNQLKRTKEAAQLIIENSNDQPFALALLAENNYDDSYEYFLKKNKTSLVDLHEENADQLFVICEYSDKEECKPLGNSKWEIAVFGVAELDNQWEFQGLNIYRLIRKDV